MSDPHDDVGKLESQQAAKSAKFKTIMGVSAVISLLMAVLVLVFGTSMGLEQGVTWLVVAALLVTAVFDVILMKSADKIVAAGRKKPTA